MNKYYLSKGLHKVIKFGVIVALPQLLSYFVYAYPEWAQLSTSAALVLVLNWVKIKSGLRIL